MSRSILPRAFRAFLVLCLLTTTLHAHAKRQTSDVQRMGERGRIDWNKGVIYATGLGAVNKSEPNQAKAYLRARAFAKLDALRNLLMVVDHVRIDSKTVGSDFEANDEIRAEVKGILKGAQVTGERKLAVRGDTMVEVTVATAMYGDSGIARVFIPETMRRAQEADRSEEEAPAERPRREEPEIGTAPVEPPVFREKLPLPDRGRDYTSVIIDTRGLRIERAMAPKIRSVNGGEVWGTMRVDPEYVIEHGIVAYARTMDEARRLDRAGDNPLILRAVARGSGRFPSDAILSEADAERLLALGDRDGFLKKCRVIFIVDPAKPLSF